MTTSGKLITTLVSMILGFLAAWAILSQPSCANAPAAALECGVQPDLTNPEDSKITCSVRVETRRGPVTVEKVIHADTATVIRTSTTGG